MGIYLVSGAASGIGSAIATQLHERGDQAITLDIANADVLCNLASPEETNRALPKIAELSGGGLDGVVSAAGVGPTNRLPSEIISVNCIGAISLVGGVRELLVSSPGASAVVVT